MKIEAIENIECLEEHEFEGDSCFACGYTNESAQCRHENTVQEEELYEAEVKSFDENGHTLVASQKNVFEVCQDCDWIINDRWVITEPVEKVEGHYLEGGCCATCGYVPACEHKNTTVDTRVDDKVVSKDEKGHTVAVHRQTITFCKDCGCTFGVFIDDSGILKTSEHTLKDGVCTVCGYGETVTSTPTAP